MEATYVLLVLVLVVIPALAIWFERRGRRRKDAEHVAVLEEFAAGVGGTVDRKGKAGAWSSHLKPPFEHTLAGFRRFLTIHRPRPEYAVEFTRGPWRVRISESSLQRPPTSGRRRQTLHERRIEVATAEVAPLMISVKQHTDFMGRPVDPNADATVPPPPATVAARQGAWVETPVHAPANQHLAAYTGDHAAAARMVNAQATTWLLDRLHPLAPRIFTFESGLLYVTLPNRIDPAKDVETVNTLLGLLDCIPEASPTGRSPDGQNHLITDAAPTTEPERKESSMTTVGMLAILVGMLAAGAGLLGYGGVNLINGGAAATGLGGTMPVLPVSWLGIDDEPLTGSDPYWMLFTGAVCYGLLALPIWLIASTSSKPKTAHSPTAPPGPPDPQS